MARRPKTGIDYSGWNVDIFENDTKIDDLLDAQGWIGFSVYFYLCQRAYASDGYFYRWSYTNATTTARRMGGGIRSETVKAAVGACLQIGLFDKRLFDTEGILTSRGIQRCYVEAIQKRTYKVVNRDFWLLKKDESKGVVFLPENVDFLPENSDFLPENNTNSKVKYSKLYYSDPAMNDAFIEYLKMRKIPETSDLVEKAKSSLMKVSGGDEQLAAKILNQSIERGWSGFYPLRESKARKKPVKNKFCNFEESGRDFNALAEEMMKTQVSLGKDDK